LPLGEAAAHTCSRPNKKAFRRGAGRLLLECGIAAVALVGQPDNRNNESYNGTAQNHEFWEELHQRMALGRDFDVLENFGHQVGRSVEIIARRPVSRKRHGKRRTSQR
jgi:hypothetical protein